jgi:glyoxylase-like metal-dependent hydrolase (beta-lactamase superfamily II)
MPAELQDRVIHEKNLLSVADDVFCLQQSLVNVIFIGAPGSADREWALIDTGLYFSAEQIRTAAAELYGESSRPAAILLTHGHFDHIGAARDLADRWSVNVWAHPLELPYVTGRASYPPPDPFVGGGAMSLLSPLYPRGPIDLGERVHALPTNGEVPELAEWQWIPTPGHSPGHVSFFRERDRMLVAGDAFVTVKQESALAIALQTKRVHPPPAYFTQDWWQAHDSIARLRDLSPAAAITGHGRPMYGEALQQGLDHLLRDWESEVPKTGRYISQPALFDETGPIAVPPPLVRTEQVCTAAFALGAAVGMMMGVRRG